MESIGIYKTKTYFLLVLLLTFSITLSSSKDETDKYKRFVKTTTNDHYAPFTINNIFNYYGNNGDGSFLPLTGKGQFGFPRGANKTAVFEDGLIWGCFQNGNLKVGGSTYRHGLQAGRIITSGSIGAEPVADNPSLPGNRIYRVRPNISPSTTFSAVELELRKEEDLVRWTTNTTASTIHSQYITDWNEWPANQGAPFEDKNGDGVYDPAVDVPGIKGADQTLWHVSNDLDSSQTLYLAGSRPIGLELQRTIWGYNQKGALGNTIFIRYKVINKSGYSLDSMYFAQWSDPDLGNAADDFVGCDTLLNLGYCYNGCSIDKDYENAPPAVGFDILQGPLIPGLLSDTAIFDLRYRTGFKNLPMTSFNFFLCGNQNYCDPVQGTYQGTLEWYNVLRGLIGSNGQPIQIPSSGVFTKFSFAGDPANGTGWIDGSIAPPGDRHMAQSTGPFTMAPGDTQEIVIGAIASQGYDRLGSVISLKQDVRLIQNIYSNLFNVLPSQLPNFSVQTSNSVTLPSQIKIKADAKSKGISAVSVTLKKYTGVTLASTVLFDDGIHDDSTASDGIFCNTISIPQQTEGLYLSATVTYAGTGNFVWNCVTDEITTAGPLELSNPVIVSDALNGDGIVNYGESIRFTVTLNNFSSIPFNNVHSTIAGSTVWYGNVPGNGNSNLVYDSSDASTYFEFTTPSTPSANGKDTVFFKIVLRDAGYNKWEIPAINFIVSPVTKQIYYTPVNHSNGLSGNFEIRIVDPSAIRNHTYIITGVDSINTKKEQGFTLIDSTTNTILLQNQSIPDLLGHTAPIIDGFKILPGNIDTSESDFQGVLYNGKLLLTINSDSYWFEGFAGSIKYGNELSFFEYSVPRDRITSVRLNFAPAFSSQLGSPSGKYAGWDTNSVTDVNYSYGYRYVRYGMFPPAQPEFTPYIGTANFPSLISSYGFADYRKNTVPFSAWNIDVTPPQRLAVGFIENNVVNGLVDGRYWPPTTSANYSTTSAKEWFFIFDKFYTDSAIDTSLQKNIATEQMPVMWTGTLIRYDTLDWGTGNSFTIMAHHPISSLDRWSFNPTVNQPVDTSNIPVTFSLCQNYPNPFNPVTTIRYSLPYTSRVTMKIYNLLGQEIRTLFDGEQIRGDQSVRWDGKSQNGIKAASGVYFYRLTAQEKNGPSILRSSRKMILVK